MTFFSFAPAPVVMRMTPEAGSTVLTRPPMPRRAQSMRSCCCFLAMSAAEMSMMEAAVRAEGVESGVMRTLTRSPAAMSENWMAVAVERSLAPGATRWRRMPSGTVILSSPLLSALTVRVPGATAVTAPETRAGA